MANHAMNAIKKLGSSSLRVVSDFALSALMDKQTANLIFGALGKGPNLRFHEREIKSIESQFNKVLRNAFTPDFKFLDMVDKDAGCSLVTKLQISNK